MAFPTAFTHQWVVFDDVIVRADHVVALVVFPLLVAGLAYFLNRTRYGVAVRAAADNSDAARLSGISVKRMSTIVWALAGGLAAVATVLSAPLAGANVASTGELGPGVLDPHPRGGGDRLHGVAADRARRRRGPRRPRGDRLLQQPHRPRA